MIEIKKLTKDKVSEFVVTHLKCWEETYFGIFPSSVMESRWRKKSDRETHILKRLEEADYFYYSLLYNGEMVGILIFSIVDEVAILDAIYLKKQYQKKGYGTKLLEFMEMVFRKKNIDQYFVYVLKPLSSKEFFIKRGANLIEEDYITIHGKDYLEIQYEMKVGKSHE